MGVLFDRARNAKVHTHSRAELTALQVPYPKRNGKSELHTLCDFSRCYRIPRGLCLHATPEINEAPPSNSEQAAIGTTPGPCSASTFGLPTTGSPVLQRLQRDIGLKVPALRARAWQVCWAGQGAPAARGPGILTSCCWSLPCPARCLQKPMRGHVQRRISQWRCGCGKKTGRGAASSAVASTRIVLDHDKRETVLKARVAACLSSGLVKCSI